MKILKKLGFFNWREKLWLSSFSWKSSLALHLLLWSCRFPFPELEYLMSASLIPPFPKYRDLRGCCFCLLFWKSLSFGEMEAYVLISHVFWPLRDTCIFLYRLSPLFVILPLPAYTVLESIFTFFLLVPNIKIWSFTCSVSAFLLSSMDNTGS